MTTRHLVDNNRAYTVCMVSSFCVCSVYNVLECAWLQVCVDSGLLEVCPLGNTVQGQAGCVAATMISCTPRGVAKVTS